MTDIVIDFDKAERIIAQIMRDDQKLQPAAANTFATAICRRLFAAMNVPTAQKLQRRRIISPWPPHGFQEAVAKQLADVNYQVASTLWDLVYERGEDLIGTIADPTVLPAARKLTPPAE